MIDRFDGLPDGAEFDFVIIGSGFGGSVSALRLAEKGYSVAVLESGRHFEDRDFARTSWQLHRWLWMPKFLLYGIQRLTLLKDVLILSGAGVGGGSLVYANTLLEPKDSFYQSPECRRLDPNLKERLRPFYEIAKRMLGVAQAPRLFAADRVLKECAEEMGRGETFHQAQVGVFFGDPGKTVPDPYFGGEGPERAGCVFCGGCMVGCRHNAKNTLMKNYLYFALKKGVTIYSLTTVVRLEEQNQEFLITVKRSGWGWKKKKIVARRLVLSAGVLGTTRLLLEPTNRLTRLSPQVARRVRTNSEVLLGSTARSSDVDYSEGIAIASGMWPDEKTHIEIVRYPAGSDAMNLLAVRDTPSGPRAIRLAHLLWATLRYPADALKTFIPFGWARRTTILLVMQTVDSRIRIELKRWLGFLGFTLGTRSEPGAAPLPLSLPIADEILKRFAAKTGGILQSSAAGTFFNVSTTAHILGGAVMAPSPQEGVVDISGKVFGYDNFWILDGSIIPANLGVNPSLTITALAEHAMSQIPPSSSGKKL